MLCSRISPSGLLNIVEFSIRGDEEINNIPASVPPPFPLFEISDEIIVGDDPMLVRLLLEHIAILEFEIEGDAPLQYIPVVP